ncbi:DEAD/DEAH box helicase [Halobacillus sp. B29]|uniref:DEAD/DEAH box helicase n=1 Tax=Halobacillus sp. B29 TaxID=3457432 RepID=UPI003FCE325E
MNIELKDFQKEYTSELLGNLERSRKDVKEYSENHAVLLSSPTGSGKTVMITKLIEDVFKGTEKFEPEPSSVFLWLSDQPELNVQSKNKIKEVSDTLNERNLEIITSDFNQEYFDGGKVYFLNTQKIGKDKNLTVKGDGREYTIWETIQNTSDKVNENFYVIIDEAHRGMNVNQREAQTAQSIIQKFLVGSEEMKPSKLIIGVSATSDRFENLVNGTDRVLRTVRVDVNKVRESGLLKDRLVVYHPDEEQPSDWSLLHTGALKWNEMCEEWKRYSVEQDSNYIEPIMVIQVEDGNEDTLTKTNLSSVINTLEEALGPIDEESIAHCFQEEKDFEVNSKKIKKIDPSNINSNPDVKFVLFKMALTTGWNCPRAEVMMSFRRAQDSTLIAQLIGRMVRTPLARRIEGNEMLNEVSLYLPHYNSETLSYVINKLKGDSDTSVATDIQQDSNLSTWSLPSSLEKSYSAMNKLPSYRKSKKLTDLKRLFTFCNLLSIKHDLHKEALPNSKQIIVDTLIEERNRLLKDSEQFANALNDAAQINVSPVVIENGEYTVTTKDSIKIGLSEANIDDLYKKAKLRFQTEVCVEYLRQNYDENEPFKSKLELFLLSQTKTVWSKLEQVAKTRITELKTINHTAINSLSSSQLNEYNKIYSAARNEEAQYTLLPKKIILPKVDVIVRYEKHLFSDESESFDTDLNTWEHELVMEELQDAEVMAWLRNFDRKPWALGVPYQKDTETEIMYPDFLVTRKINGGYITDILEPHHENLSDSLAKAKGLADYANRHGAQFGRIQLIRQIDGNLKRLELNDFEIRQKVMRLMSHEELNRLFSITSV